MELLFDDDLIADIRNNPELHRKIYEKLYVISDGRKGVTKVLEKVGVPVRFEELPPEIVHTIGSSMKLKDVSSLARTSKKLESTLTGSPRFWSHRLANEYDVKNTYTPKKTYIRKSKEKDIVTKINDLIKEDNIREIFTYMANDDVVEYIQQHPRFHKIVYNKILLAFEPGIPKDVRRSAKRLLDKIGVPEYDISDLYEE